MEGDMLLWWCVTRVESRESRATAVGSVEGDA
jgi:hypothetical protein